MEGIQGLQIQYNENFHPLRLVWSLDNVKKLPWKIVSCVRGGSLFHVCLLPVEKKLKQWHHKHGNMKLKLERLAMILDF